MSSDRLRSVPGRLKRRIAFDTLPVSTCTRRLPGPSRPRTLPFGEHRLMLPADLVATGLPEVAAGVANLDVRSVVPDGGALALPSLRD